MCAFTFFYFGNDVNLAVLVNSFFLCFKDDPWMAAHQFLERNDLSQMFLDQVVDFILKNTKGVTIGQQTPAAGDPFTGMKLLTPSPLGCAVNSAHVSTVRAENRELK